MTSEESPEYGEGFDEGFMFALIVFNSMLDEKVSTEELAKFLIDVVNRKVSLSPSPPDAIASMETEIGKTMPENLRKSVHQVLGKDRSRLDESNRRRAERTLKYMGYDVV